MKKREAKSNKLLITLFIIAITLSATATYLTVQTNQTPKTTTKTENAQQAYIGLTVTNETQTKTQNNNAKK